LSGSAKKKLENAGAEKDTKKRSTNEVGKKADAKKAKVEKEEENKLGRAEYLTESLEDAKKRAAEFTKHIKYVKKV
jgi:hypothetical protein